VRAVALDPETRHRFLTAIDAIDARALRLRAEAEFAGVTRHATHNQKDHGREGAKGAVEIIGAVAAGPTATHPGIDALPKLERDPSVTQYSHLTDDAYATNPRYGEPQFDNNCVHVVSAYELRRRDLDATASPLPERLGDNGRNAQEALERWVLPDGRPHGRSVSVHSGVTAQEVIATTEAWPDDARGWIAFSYDRRYGAGGHIFNVEKIDGEVIFVDAQSSEPYLDLKQFIQRSKEAGEAPVWGVVRVDDLEPTDAVMEFIEQGGR
jgi:hypothetical protein